MGGGNSNELSTVVASETSESERFHVILNK